MAGAPPFFDTNVLLYLLSADKAKADRAEDLVAAGGIVSVQVLNEFASVARRKLAMTWPEVRDCLALLRATLGIEPLTPETHDGALDIAERYGFAFYDALILSAARMAGCRTLYSEDLQDGQVFEPSLTVRNPFR